MGEERLVKANFICSVTIVEKTTDEEGKEVYKVKESKNEKWKGKEFTESMMADRIKGIDHTIQIVMNKPEHFQLNVIYILADGTRMWIWVEDKLMESNVESSETAAAAQGNEITPEEAQAINDAAAGEQIIVEMEGE